MKTRLLHTLALSAVATIPSLFAQPGTAGTAGTTNTDEARDVLEQWVETRQIISQERSDWKTEKAILTDTVDLLSSELERLDTEIAELETSATAADEEREQLTARRDALSAGSDAVLDNIGELETQIKMIVAKLPDPLTDKIQPLIRRLPDDPESTKMSLGERVQNIVGVLSQADKFNTTMTLTSETQEMESGKRVQVNTLYWGNAIAYFVDDTGEYAGIGSPTEDGWEWTQLEDAGGDIRELLSVYDGSADTIKFVKVPARIQ